jgi:ABC-type glutathione transport system ATPase component
MHANQLCSGIRMQSPSIINKSPHYSSVTGYADEAGSEKLCKDISISFGGSGYKNSGILAVDDAPLLLSAPVRISDKAPDLKNQKRTYGGAVIAGADDGSDPSPSGALSSNSLMDVSAIPTTQKQLRKMRKENEVLQKILKAESLARATAAAEMAAARMAAIKASRSAGRQANTGVNIERLSLPHPSGTGDLLTDATLVLAPGRRYGLVGRNGAGKSTLLRCLANYKVEGLVHLRILLVEQHVEGDEDTALQWLLRADVERTSLLEDEARLSAFLHGSTNDPLPADLKGVNLEVALSECFERMDAIGVHTAENRASKILFGLGFDEHMLTKPTCDLSGGWAMRAALGAALFVKPNLLLLGKNMQLMCSLFLHTLPRSVTLPFK